MEQTTDRRRRQYKSEVKEDLRQRLLNISSRIGNDYVGDICRTHPEYNTQKGRRRLIEVRNMIVTDIDITLILENYVKEKEEMLEKIRQQNKNQ